MPPYANAMGNKMADKSGIKPTAWGLEAATALAGDLLKPGAPIPVLSNVSQTLHKGFVGVADRWVLTVVEIEPGVIELAMKDSGDQRAQRLTQVVRSEAELSACIETWRGKFYWWCERLSVYRLQPQKTYRVHQTFTDYYGHVFEAGQELTFVKRNFLPYDGGHTLTFQPAAVYLQEDLQAEILENLDLYLAEI